MPVLESTENVDIAPKSLIRHRPIGEGKKGAPVRDTLASGNPTVSRASRLKAPDAEPDIAEWKREEQEPKATSEPRRATSAIRPKARFRYALPPLRALRQIERGKLHPVFFLGIGMLAMLLLSLFLMTFVNWLSTTIDDIHYGRPRTFQTDAYVGHNENGVPSHFIAMNLSRHIQIIEIPGGDASHARIYLGPQLYGTGDELTPVTLTFLDVNNDHKPDMLISFQGSRVVFINDQGGFRPLLASERVQVEQFLQRLG